jgi:hypothetical protein
MNEITHFKLLLQEGELDRIVRHGFIKTSEAYPTPPVVISIDGAPIATLGNFSASTGKAKAKKTFNVSAIVAASLSGRRVLQYDAHLPGQQQRILYIDTEQSRFHCHRVLQRILRLAGLPTDQDCARLDLISLREYPAAHRVQVIDYRLRTTTGYGLVVIDGLRDLLVDFNSVTESLELIDRLMNWSSHYNLHIHVVLHLNKADDNVRGHIGTELNNKAETVLVVSKCVAYPSASEVHATHLRDRDFPPFTFAIDKEGLPELVDRRASGETSRRPMNYTELTTEQHIEALTLAFSDTEIRSYRDLIEALTRTYAAVGFERRRTVITQMINYLQDDLGYIQKEDKTYRLHLPNLSDTQ